MNDVERRYQSYTTSLSIPGASLDAAVATAAHDVLLELSRSQREKSEADTCRRSPQFQRDAKADAPPIPEYPSAAATVASAAAEVLERMLGDRHHFEATSPFLPGVTRRFSSFTQAAEEAGMPRVYGGIHFLRAVSDGSQLGKSVGRDVSRLLPRAGRDD